MSVEIKSRYTIRYRETPKGQPRNYMSYYEFTDLQEMWTDDVADINRIYDPVEIWVEQRLTTVSIERLQTVYQ